MTYLPIENYGIIGNMRTVALVGTNGSIDWMCLPRIDSPSVFGGILDHDKGGHFQIHPAVEGATEKQIYWPETNVLVTRFLTPDGVGEVRDFMPIEARAGEQGRSRLVRIVTVDRGAMAFRMECRPAFDYARARHEVAIDASGVSFHSPALSLRLDTLCRLTANVMGGAVAEFTLTEGHTEVFVLGETEPGAEPAGPPTEQEATELFKSTVDYWRRWISRSTYRGRWREMVQRSALALKLMTYEPTGAIVASPTCSLPERVAGDRNWDYRFTWIRDAAFTLYGLMRIGFTEEAAQFMEWLEGRCVEMDAGGSLQVIYSIDGRSTLTEETLGHLEGYKGSRPVRIGNGAYNQLQLDIYGELMDSVYLYNKYGTPISHDMWILLRGLVDWVCDNWHRPDEGVWEVRGGPQHFVYSKLMCWVALDRGLRLADKRSFPADRDRWLKCRDQIYQDIMAKGWSEKRQAFVQHYGSDSLDAANLMMPLVFFLSPSDPRMLKTIDAINRSPENGGLVSNSLVYRYDAERTADGVGGGEGTFNICTFWLVEALTRAGRRDPSRLEDARLMFEQMLGYANHLGLYGEETGPSGEALGNFPQAFTHLGLISAAFNLDRALGPDRERG